ncbi:MAG: hypothetical protein IAE80_04350 [Anaerolinea sp.]|nr:hypothetical protein [Anaerolinea sp.]
MPGKSPFSDDWRDCLKAHYTHVIRENDTRTEKTLRTVLYECGFSADDLKAWYVLATMHVDDVSPDFVPDAEIVQAAAQQPEAKSPPVAVAVSVAVAEVPPVVDASFEPLVKEADDVPTPEDAPPEDDPPPDPNGFTQLSLF